MSMRRWKVKYHFGIIYHSQKMEATLVSIDRWMDKEDICIHYGIVLSHTKEWINTSCSNTDGPRDYHTKWSKLERQIPYITYMWNLNVTQWTYLWNRLTDIENRLGVSKRGDGLEEGWTGSLGLAKATIYIE